MIINWSVKSEGKGTRTIQYPDERIEGAVRTQELACLYVCVGQGRGHQQMMGVDDTPASMCWILKVSHLKMQQPTFCRFCVSLNQHLIYSGLIRSLFGFFWPALGLI